jgi:hypothetical protein
VVCRCAQLTAQGQGIASGDVHTNSIESAWWLLDQSIARALHQAISISTLTLTSWSSDSAAWPTRTFLRLGAQLAFRDVTCKNPTVLA